MVKVVKDKKEANEAPLMMGVSQNLEIPTEQQSNFFNILFY